MHLRSAELQDIGSLLKIEEEFYEGSCCPEKTLRQWIVGLPQNFIVAEERGRIVGFVFFEYFDKIKTVPFVHQLEHDKNGKYVYVSDIGILDEFQGSGVLQMLFRELVNRAKGDGCRTVLWLTGSIGKHDKIELELLQKNKFTKRQKVKNWEAYPNCFVNDHAIWTKRIQPSL